MFKKESNVWLSIVHFHRIFIYHYLCQIEVISVTIVGFINQGVPTILSTCVKSQQYTQNSAVVTCQNVERFRKAQDIISSPHHPSTPCFCSSEMPKESDPIKSFRLVKSQSHTSTDRRRSLSLSLSLLRDINRKKDLCECWLFLFQHINESFFFCYYSKPEKHW